MDEILGRFKKSKATSFIMLINLVVFILILINGGFTSENLLRFGASNSELIIKGQYYRVFTQLFVHSSYFHFIFNMLVIYMIGPSIENKYGPWVLISVFLLAGLFDELLSFLILGKWEAGGGSSTGYFGLYGLAIGALLFYKDRNLKGWSRQFILPMLFVFIASEIYFRIIGGRPQLVWGYSHSHLGGFLAGVILAGVFPPKGYQLNKKIRLCFAIFFVGLLITFFFVAYFSGRFQVG